MLLAAEGDYRKVGNGTTTRAGLKNLNKTISGVSA
jgi:hypothetical protein